MNYRTQDAEFCGKVPLNQTNLIQPYGALVVLHTDSLDIIQVSENVQAVFNMPAVEFVGKSFAGFINDGQIQTLQARAKQQRAERLPMTLTINGTDYLALVHTKQNYLIAEIELKRDDNPSVSFVNMYQHLKGIMAEVENAPTTVAACDIAIKELKRLTGFDKIMVYQFDEEWHGTVIAEAAEESMDSYMGLRFPASDVPKQARDLYLKNPYRLIPDAHYVPVKLHPLLNPTTHAFTDLSDTNLRSVAGVHIQYLKNMGVAASMSTRIIQDDQLWGLIACHNRTPKYLTHEMCFVFELVSGIISAKIAAMQKGDVAAYRAELSRIYQQILEAVYRQGDLVGILQQRKEDLLRMLNAQGAALILQRQITLMGKTPTQQQVENLMFWLKSHEISHLFHQSNLSDSYVDAENFTATASGLMALPIEPEKGDYLLAFRPEAVKTVDWGGNPNEAITFSADKKSYHPRHSFKIWQETVRATAIPWKKEELEIAEQFRTFLVNYTRGIA